MNEHNRRLSFDFLDRKILELGLSLFLGVLLGILVITTLYLPLSADWQRIILVIPFA